MNYKIDQDTSEITFWLEGVNIYDNEETMTPKEWYDFSQQVSTDLIDAITKQAKAYLRSQETKLKELNEVQP